MRFGEICCPYRHDRYAAHAAQATCDCQASLPVALAARAVALAVLQAVLYRRRALDEAMEENEAWRGLRSRDRAFARLLVATTLRRLGRIDALIAHCLKRPLGTHLAPLHDVLRLGICQLLFLNTPLYAAVDTAVTLAAVTTGPAGKGLVNAILRRLAHEGRSLAAMQDPPWSDIPDWLWRSWSAAYGPGLAGAIAKASLMEAPLDLSVKQEPTVWAERLAACHLPTGSLRLRCRHSGSVNAMPGFAEGAWWVQDTAAALPVLLLGDVAGRTVVDLCAAPGGKTAQLAVAGARVFAVDRAARRLTRLAANLDRLSLSETVRIVDADVTVWQPPAPVDAVLLDAPCSATGTLRRHPDVLHLKGPADVARLVVLQARLLAAAVSMLKPGGILVYCVCSLEPEEGPEQVAAALAAGLPLTYQPVSATMIGDAAIAPFLTPAGELRTLPCYLAGLGGMDAFYAVRLVRT